MDGRGITAQVRVRILELQFPILRFFVWKALESKLGFPKARFAWKGSGLSSNEVFQNEVGEDDAFGNILGGGFSIMSFTITLGNDLF